MWNNRQSGNFGAWKNNSIAFQKLFHKKNGSKVEFGVSIIENARLISFSVKDYGTGIEKSDFPKIFEWVYRNHNNVPTPIS